MAAAGACGKRGFKFGHLGSQDLPAVIQNAGNALVQVIANPVLLGA